MNVICKLPSYELQLWRSISGERYGHLLTKCEEEGKRRRKRERGGERERHTDTVYSFVTQSSIMQGHRS